MINFLHHYSPRSIIFSVGGLDIHWYGLLMVLGGLLGLFLAWYLARYFKINRPWLFDLAFWWAIFGLIGGRIYYVIYAFDFYKDNPLDIFKIWQGGLAVHGVMIGAFCATFFFARAKGINWLKLFDLSAIGLVTAQIVGRWGNYFNQELFGRPTDLAWGIPILPINRPVEYIAEQFFHPTFLYESLLNIVLLGILLILVWLRFGKNIEIKNGIIFFSYILGYSIIRFNMEFLRLDYSPVVFGVRWAQLFSGLLILASIFFIVFCSIRKGKRTQIKKKIEKKINLIKTEL
ncbi:MAG: prolipoprotein diacylglyceryl transferase [Patescibacteria group bacterium]